MGMMQPQLRVSASASSEVYEAPMERDIHLRALCENGPTAAVNYCNEPGLKPTLTRSVNLTESASLSLQVNGHGERF
ncbi:unnamed protein product [Gadus morhua 'NCC']